MSKHYIIKSDPSTFDYSITLTSGEWVDFCLAEKVDIAKKIELCVEAKSPLLDSYFYKDVMLISEDLKNVFDEIPINDIQYVEILLEHVSTRENCKFYLVNILRLVDGVDRENSEIIFTRRGSVASIERLILDEKKIAPYSFFRLKENDEIIVSEEVKDILEFEDLAGYDFVTDDSTEIINPQRFDNFITVISQGDIESLNQLPSNELNEMINVCNDSGYSPLTLAVEKGHYDIVSKLLRSMILESEAPDDNDNTAIEIAISKNDKKMCQIILSMAYQCDFEQRLTLILKAGLELPSSERCTIIDAQHILDNVPNLTKEQQKAYELRAGLSLSDDREGFDIDVMVESIISALKGFSSKYPNELFSAFCIDAGQCSLVLKDEINNKANSGNYKYSNIVELENGFDLDAYNEHYEANEKEQENSLYTQAMKELFDRLIETNVFVKLKITDDFKLILDEHGY